MAQPRGRVAGGAAEDHPNSCFRGVGRPHKARRPTPEQNISQKGQETQRPQKQKKLISIAHPETTYISAYHDQPPMRSLIPLTFSFHHPILHSSISLDGRDG